MYEKTVTFVVLLMKIMRYN